MSDWNEAETLYKGMKKKKERLTKDRSRNRLSGERLRGSILDLEDEEFYLKVANYVHRNKPPVSKHSRQDGKAITNNQVRGYKPSNDFLLRARLQRQHGELWIHKLWEQFPKHYYQDPETIPDQ